MSSSESRVIDMCQDLVRIPSLSGEERAVAELVEEEMGALGFDQIERDELGSVVGIRHLGHSGPTLVFDAHMDVVPATEPERWGRPPFSGKREGGRVWGRGSTDTKGSLAAMLIAVGTAKASEFRGTLIVSASVGEEAMEGRALGVVLDRHRADVVVIGEPTGLCLGLGHKGRTSIVVEATGVAAHTSQPKNGTNAVYRMNRAIPTLRAIPMLVDDLLGEGIMELVEIASQPFPGSSMVPWACTSRFDRRLVRGETRESVLAQLKEALTPHEGLSARLHRSNLRCYTGVLCTEEVFHPCWALEPDAPIVTKALEALGRASLPITPFYAPYCTNGSCSAGERGIPTLLFGPGHIKAAHALDESVDESQLTGALRGYRALIAALARSR
ncbi:MAG: YgeY family selenium metabolism-linked hydrolase [Proteobacteria bacterium]|jgi:putative selenium metabolism hydrolase|nr:YgeY family selenium metabolism-linked hydrolase [Pseudomonadota bacterium]